MYPILFHLGPIPVYTYGVMVSLGFILGYQLLIKWAKQEGVSELAISDLFLILVVTSMTGARITYILSYPEHFRHDWTSVFRVWEGGLTILGGAVLAFICFYLYCRKKNLDIALVLDLFSPAIAFGLIFGRLGCLGFGCCYGIPTDLPWGLTFPNTDMLIPPVPRHPTQIYTSLCMIVIFLLLRWFRKKEHVNGTVSIVFLLVYTVYRFIIEMFRQDVASEHYLFGLTLAQSMSLVASVAALVYYLTSLRYSDNINKGSLINGQKEKT